MFVENVTPFFDPSAFGDSATLTIGTGAPSAVNVVFDRAYTDPFGSFEGLAPVAWIPATSAGAARQGDTLTIGTTTYTIVEVMPDGSGNVVQFRLRT